MVVVGLVDVMVGWWWWVGGWVGGRDGGLVRPHEDTLVGGGMVGA